MTCKRLNTIFLFMAVLVAALPLAGCSEKDRPDNLEPIIEMLPASEITRTQARVTAKIHKRGVTSFTHVAFRYGKVGSEDITRTEVNADASTVTMLLTGLKPGTRYNCCLEVSTSTASIVSEPVAFNTVPNNVPTVTQPVALSSGPTGIIVEFEITDDGGEALIEAGCEVTDAMTGKVRRLTVASNPLASGTQRLAISNLTPLSAFSIIPFASNSVGEFKGEALEFTTQNSIVLKEAGTLSVIFEESQVIDLKRLPISGPMNGDDFRFLRHLLGAPALGNPPSIKSNVSEIDLTDVSIVEGGGTFDGSRFTVTDKIETGLLADCSRLRVALLPSSATVLARDALARNPNLNTLTIPAGIVKLLPSEGCESLRQIDVSAGNSHFASIDGVLFNRDCTTILWFPLGKTGNYSIPATVMEIGENAFYGTKIVSLVIPPSVTHIGRGAFAGSSLIDVTLPDNQNNVSEAMFQGCSSLKSVILGSGTKYVGDYAFDGTALAHLYVRASTPPFAASEAFCNRNSTIFGNCVLHVPMESAKIYRNHSKWGRFENIKEF